MRRVAVLMGDAARDPEGEARFGAFRARLTAQGWAEGGNLRLDVRWAGGDEVRTRTLATEIVATHPDAILVQAATGLAPLMQNTKTIPIVFVGASDPVRQGFVKSLNRPGGNVTGFTNFEFSIGGKWIELLREAAPRLQRVRAMGAPDTVAHGWLDAIASAAARAGMTAEDASVRDDVQIERAVAGLGGGTGGLIALPDVFIRNHRRAIIAAAAHMRVPAIYPVRVWTADGALMSYGPDLPALYRAAAGYVDRILKGADPGELPVQAPTKFELVINLATAKALGISLPQALLVTADEVIE